MVREGLQLAGEGTGAEQVGCPIVNSPMHIPWGWGGGQGTGHTDAQHPAPFKARVHNEMAHIHIHKQLSSLTKMWPTINGPKFTRAETPQTNKVEFLDQPKCKDDKRIVEPQKTGELIPQQKSSFAAKEKRGQEAASEHPHGPKKL